MVELLAVVAILVIMTAMVASSLTGFFSSLGRRGAVNTVVSTLERARVAALENGTNVHVVFWKRTFPEQDAFMVLRDRTDSDNPPEGTGGANPLIPLTTWAKLGTGVILRDIAMLKSGGGGEFTGDISAFITQGATDDEKRPERFFAVTYNYLGAVVFPPQSASTPLQIFVSQGVRDPGGNEAAIAAGGASASFLDRIAIARFTGRARVELSPLP